VSERRAILGLGGACAVGLAIAMLGLAHVSTIRDGLVVLAFYAWNLAPVAIACLIGARTRHRPLRRAMLLFVPAYALFEGVAIARAFSGIGDAQSGLVFLFAPTIGWMALPVMGLIAALIIRFGRRG
jgi:hypothetical protein